MKNASFASLALLFALPACSSVDNPTTGAGGANTTAASGNSTGSTTGAGTGSGGGATTGASTTASTGTGSAKTCADTPVGGDRPVTVHVPKSYKCGTPAPLLVMLHGYSASGTLEEAYLNLTAESEKRGFLYAHPDGMKDGTGNQFWNATDACCNFVAPKIDDSAYLSALITEIEAQFDVDTKRVYLFGHSNGGFMSYRMACDHGDQITAIASLAGAMWMDTSKCPTKTPVSVLELHGTADAVIGYNGGANGGIMYPSAATSVADWATINGCAMPADATGAPLDLEGAIFGAETTPISYKGCQAGTNVALWTIQGGSHIPTLSKDFWPDILDFLYAQQKP